MIAMAAMMAQLEWGDFDDQDNPTEQYAHFSKFLPPAKQAAWSSNRSKSTNGKRLFKLSEDKAVLTQKIVTYWRSLSRKLVWSLGCAYVDEARKSWQFFGSNIFPAKARWLPRRTVIRRSRLCRSPPLSLPRMTHPRLCGCRDHA